VGRWFESTRARHSHKTAEISHFQCLVADGLTNILTKPMFIPNGVETPAPLEANMIYANEARAREVAAAWKRSHSR
jgi:hypothetical protein